MYHRRKRTKFRGGGSGFQRTKCTFTSILFFKTPTSSTRKLLIGLYDAKKNGDDWAGQGVIHSLPRLKRAEGLGPHERKGRRICGDALVRNLQTCRPLMLPSLSLQRALRMSFLTRKIRAWLKIKVSSNRGEFYLCQ